MIAHQNSAGNHLFFQCFGLYFVWEAKKVSPTQLKFEWAFYIAFICNTLAFNLVNFGILVFLVFLNIEFLNRISKVYDKIFSFPTM